jgi:hypothetical protein
LAQLVQVTLVTCRNLWVEQVVEIKRRQADEIGELVWRAHDRLPWRFAWRV